MPPGYNPPPPKVAYYPERSLFQVNYLTNETHRLQKNGQALDRQNNKLKNQLMAITKQRYECDLESLQSKQIKFDKEYWNTPITDKDR